MAPKKAKAAKGKKIGKILLKPDLIDKEVKMVQSLSKVINTNGFRWQLGTKFEILIVKGKFVNSKVVDMFPLIEELSINHLSVSKILD